MPFDPTKPVEGSDLDAAEMRNQLNALKALIDAQAAQIAALQTQIAALQDALAGKATLPTMDEFDPGYSDPPTHADLMSLQGGINELLAELKS